MPTMDQLDEWPSARAAWFGVAVLMGAGLIGIMDHQIFNLVVDPVRHSLGFSDVQIGVLQGIAFTLFYMVFALPLGWLVDRLHRIRLTGLGMLVMGAGTIGCGIAHSFAVMFASRTLMGIGQAALAPAAISLIADYFSPQKRPVAMSVYGAYEMGGAGVSLLTGGAMLVAAGSLQHIGISGMADIAPWRFVFFAAGAPALLLAAILGLVNEPRRRDDETPGGEKLHAGAGTASQQDLWKFLVRARGWLIPHLVSISVVATVSMGLLNWMPTVLIRDHGWQAKNIGFTYGVLFLFLGPAGTLSAGYVSRILQRRSMEDAALRMACLGSLIVCGAVSSIALQWTSRAMLVPIGIAVFGTSLVPMVSIVAIQHATPNSLRGRVSAIYYLVTGIVAGNLGPLIPSLLTQYVFHNPDSIGKALGIMGAVGAPLTAAGLIAALGPYRRLVSATSAAKPPGAVQPVPAP